MIKFLIIYLLFFIILLSAIWKNSPSLQIEVKEKISGYSLLLKALENNSN